MTTMKRVALLLQLLVFSCLLGPAVYAQGNDASEKDHRPAFPF